MHISIFFKGKIIILNDFFLENNVFLYFFKSAIALIKKYRLLWQQFFSLAESSLIPFFYEFEKLSRIKELLIH